MATVEGIMRCGQLIQQAIALIDSGANPRPVLVQAYAALVNPPPAPEGPIDTDVPGTKLLRSGPYAGMWVHTETGNVMPEAQMRDYVARLAAQWTGSPPTWDAWAQARQDEPQGPQQPTGETPL